MFDSLKKAVIYFFQFGIFAGAKAWSLVQGHYQSLDIPVARNKKHIVIANHVTPHDPILLLKSTSWRSFFRLAPFKVMIDANNMTSRWQKLLYIFGCYPSHKYKPGSKKNMSLQLSKHYLSQDYSIIIFPEGGSKKKKPGVGARYLNTRTPNSLLHLFSIKKKTNQVSYKGTENHYGTQTEDLWDLYGNTMEKVI